MKNTALLILLLIQITTVSAWSSGRLSVASWNVENLFDADHDVDSQNKDKWDYAYLPKNHPLKESGCKATSLPQYLRSCLETDWTPAHVRLKYQQIKRMFETLPKKPDFLVILEIENARVLKELAQVLGYSGWAISHWDDERGVDTGILFNQKNNLRFLKSQSIAIPLGQNLTRPILQTKFLFDSTELHVYINHWPSGANPESERVIAAQQVRKQIDLENRSRQKKPFSVVLGDFNVNTNEFPRPFLPLFDTSWQNRLLDLDTLARQNGIMNSPGTYFYAKEKMWNMLDRVLVSTDFFGGNGLKIPINKFKIVDKISTNIQIRETGEKVQNVPYRYNHSTLDPAKAGFSDHFPVYFEIVSP